MTPVLRESLATALALLVFSVVGASLLSGTFTLTHPGIERSEQADKLRLVAQTLPAGSYDNDLIRDARPLPAATLLGLRRPGLLYPASQGGQVNAVVLEAVAPDGYSGEIRLLVGILADGRVAGVRVVAHKETPGLGDYIDILRSAWIRQFDGRSLDDPAAGQWKVKKDGGRFDYRASATITPRAVVKAVRKALEYFATHRAELLAPIADRGAAR
jgi:Na+-translocating ferredoxin:NAD+ oxidoreductase subunit G